MTENTLTAIVFGATGAIGSAFIKCFIDENPGATVHAVSRSPIEHRVPGAVYYQCELDDEQQLMELANNIMHQSEVDLIVVAVGALHTGDVLPEKSFKDLSKKNFATIFEANSIVPALIGKHFIPLMRSQVKSCCVFLSARVGSISDNKLGGWYAYRASKSALNMLVKCFAIEVARKNKCATIVGYQPGTVDSHLSKPFQHNISKEKIFTPHQAAQKLLRVINKLDVSHSGSCVDWKDSVVLP